MGYFMSFFITLSAVASMLIFTVPAYALVKFKVAKSEHIPVLAAILLYLCTPSIIINSFLQLDFSPDTISNLGIYLLLSFLIQFIMMGGVWLIVKKSENKKNRIAAIASSLGNCGFFGVPLLRALFPQNPEAVIYSALFSISMNAIAFTFGSLIISGDKKYIKVKKVFLNPAMIGTFISIPLFILGIDIPDILGNALASLVAISTPLCMFVLGMRLATIKLSHIFTNTTAYLTVCAKQLTMPLIAFAITLLLPLDPMTEAAFIIISSCPVATVVLNLSELLGEGQKHAADCVLLGTILSISTMPIISLLI